MKNKRFEITIKDTKTGEAYEESTGCLFAVVDEGDGCNGLMKAACSPVVALSVIKHARKILQEVEKGVYKEAMKTALEKDFEERFDELLEGFMKNKEGAEE